MICWICTICKGEVIFKIWRNKNLGKAKLEEYCLAWEVWCKSTDAREPQEVLGISPGRELCLVSVQSWELTPATVRFAALCLLGRGAVLAVRLLLCLLEPASVIVSTAPVDVVVTECHLCFGTLLNPVLTAWDNSLCQYSVTLKAQILYPLTATDNGIFNGQEEL